MTYHVELTFQAEQDIDHILDWLRRRSPQGAATWPSGSEAVTRCHLSGKENGRFPNAMGFTSSATCLLKLGGKGTRLEIKVR